ncbi:MAG: hypothetical protein ABEK10_00840 [Candidatus Nanosalina sp.]
MLKETEIKQFRTLLAVAAALAITVFTVSHSNLRTPEYQKLNRTSPLGEKINSVNEYRFSKLNNSILYGPYLVNDTRFFVHNNRVLNENLEETSNKQVRNLHRFYLKTYLDPLFYSPVDEGKKFALKNFEKFESEKILTDRCGLSYDLIPQNYFNSLERNHRYTEDFLEKASRENAIELIQENRRTVKAYSGYIGNFTDVITKKVSRNKCFTNGSAENTAIVTLTPGKYQIKFETIVNYTKTVNTNARKLLEEIEEREKILENGRKFEIDYNVSLPRFFGEVNLKWNETKTRSIINSRRTREYHGRNIDETGLDLRTVDKVETFLMQPSCLQNTTVEITGAREDIYPNIMTRDRLFPKSHPFEGLFGDFFSVSKCPYVEKTRLKWYVMEDIISEVRENPAYVDYSGVNARKLESAERFLTEEPDQRHFQELSDTYYQVLRKSVSQGVYSDKLGIIWRRSIQSRSKIDQFEETYNDFYNSYHMKVWKKYWPTPVDKNGKIPESSKFTPSKFFTFVLMESEYPLTFMTWSESVWRLDKAPDKFSGRYKKSGEDIPTIWQPEG